MNSHTPFWRTFWLLALGWALLLTACGSASAPGARATVPPPTGVAQPVDEAAEMVNGELVLPWVDPAEAQGKILIAGSATLTPLTEVMVQRFQDEGFTGTVTIEAYGEDSGFTHFCEGTGIDLIQALHPPSPAAMERCRTAGRPLVPFRVGSAAVFFIVAHQNPFLKDLSTQELASVFSTAQTWAEIQATWPPEPILRYGPEAGSEDFEAFVAQMFPHQPDLLLNAAHLTLADNPIDLLRGVAASPYAIGFLGNHTLTRALADGASEGVLLRVLTVDGIEPLPGEVQNRRYPFVQPLYLYSSPTVLQQKPQVATFLNFYLSYVNEEIEDLGFFAAETPALNEARDN